MEELFDRVPAFLDHQFIKLNQAKTASQHIHQSLLPNSEEAVICCDFAEKFKCVTQNATQSAHYGETPISIFTIAQYHKKMEAKAIASDHEKQTKDCVLAYMDLLLSKLPSSVKKVNVWSDNASSQFKNQFIMNSMKYFENRYSLKLCWNFYAAMHGKSVVDGIGGTVKRYVKDRIRSQDIIVRSAHDFAKIAEDCNIEVIPMTTSDISARNKKIGFAEIVNSSKNIKGIKAAHSFETSLGKKNVKKILCHKITPENL